MDDDQEVKPFFDGHEYEPEGPQELAFLKDIAPEDLISKRSSVETARLKEDANKANLLAQKAFVTASVFGATGLVLLKMGVDNPAMNNPATAATAIGMWAVAGGSVIFAGVKAELRDKIEEKLEDYRHRIQRLSEKPKRTEANTANSSESGQGEEAPEITPEQFARLKRKGSNT